MNLYQQLSLFEHSPAPAPAPAPAPDRRGIFQIGDRVEVRRKGLLFGKVATIKAFRGNDALVESPGWRISPQFPLSELRIYRPPVETF